MITMINIALMLITMCGLINSICTLKAYRKMEAEIKSIKNQLSLINYKLVNFKKRDD